MVEMETEMGALVPKELSKSCYVFRSLWSCIQKSNIRDWLQNKGFGWIERERELEFEARQALAMLARVARISSDNLKSLSQQGATLIASPLAFPKASNGS